MKDFIILITLFLLVFGFKSMAFDSVPYHVYLAEVEGTLFVQRQIDKPIKVIIKTDEGILDLENTTSSHPEGCTYGTYHLEENQYNGKFKLLKVVECLDDQLQGFKVEDRLICPEIWMPACGNQNDIVKTFGNICELKASNAKFISMGECL